MKTLFYHKKKSITIATNWGQLTAKQYIKIVKLLHSGITDIGFASDKALRILSGKWLLFFLLVPVDLRMRMWPHVQWIFENDELLTRQLLPSYKKIFGKKLYGPAGEFDNLILSEFHHTEIAFQDIIKNTGNGALDTLAAILYRPAKNGYDMRRNKDGDVRIAFNAAEIEWNKKTVRRWPNCIKQAIALWYAGCREQFVKNYDEAFDNTSNSGENYYQGLFGMIRSIAGGKYGNFKEVENMLLHNAFMEIVSAKHDEEELNRKYPQTA